MGDRIGKSVIWPELKYEIVVEGPMMLGQGQMSKWAKHVQIVDDLPEGTKDWVRFEVATYKDARSLEAHLRHHPIRFDKSYRARVALRASDDGMCIVWVQRREIARLTH